MPSIACPPFLYSGFLQVPVGQERSARKWSQFPQNKRRRFQNCTSEFNLLELLEAFAHPNVDFLFLHGHQWLDSDDDVKDYIGILMATQDREWHISLLKGTKTLGVDLTFLSLFKPVRSIALDVFTEPMLPVVKSFPRLDHLDISKAPIRPEFLHTLYEDESIASKIPHIMLSITGMDRERVDLMRFPPLANTYLRGLALQLDVFSKSTILRWIAAASQLENLRYLHVSFWKGFFETREGSNSFSFNSTLVSRKLNALCFWVRWPSCQLTHLYIEHRDCWFTEIALEKFFPLIEAIGQNRSLQEICLSAVCTKMTWDRDISPSLLKSNIHHLVMEVGDWDTSESKLVEWILAMRHTRLWSIVDVRSTKSYPRLEYVSRVNKRWKKSPRTFLFQEKDREPSLAPRHPTGASPAVVLSLPRELWARELEQIDETDDELLRPLSLDTTFFLLQRWMTSISRIPPLNHCNF